MQFNITSCRTRNISAVLFLLGCGLAFGGSMGKQASVYSTLKQGHFEFMAGGYWSHHGRSQHIDIEGLVGDYFNLEHSADANALVGLGYLMDARDYGSLQLHYGIKAFFLPRASASGTVYQEDVFSNLSYKYHISNYPVYLGAKASIPLLKYPAALTVDAGLGPNFMHTGGFREHSLDGGLTLPDDIFSGRTATTFSATAGAGLKIASVFGGNPLECGYRFFYLGKGRFNRTTDQVITPLRTGSAYANALLCTFSFS